MTPSLEILTVLAFLVPGFLASLVLNALVVRVEKDPLARIVEALVFSLVIYTVIPALTGATPVELNVLGEGADKHYTLSFDSKSVALMIATSLVLALVISVFVTHDWHMKFLRWIHVTNRTARPSAWLDVFNDQKRYVFVNFTDGRRLFGWPMYYSYDRDEGIVYLYDAAWVIGDKYQQVEGHGIMVVQKDLIEAIQFLDFKFNPAKGAIDVAETAKPKAEPESDVAP